MRLCLSPKFNDKPTIHMYPAIDRQFHFAVIVIAIWPVRNDFSEWNAIFLSLFLRLNFWKCQFAFTIHVFESSVRCASLEFPRSFLLSLFVYEYDNVLENATPCVSNHCKCLICFFFSALTLSVVRSVVRCGYVSEYGTIAMRRDREREKNVSNGHNTHNICMSHN